MSPRSARRLLAGLASLLATVALAAPAHAERGQVLVGERAQGPFAQQLPGRLFDDLGPMVPRTSATETFYVKNASRHGARAVAKVVKRGPRNAFSRALSVAVDLGADEPVLRWDRPRTEARSCHEYWTAPVKPGEVLPVRVDLALRDLKRTRGAGQTASVDVIVTMVQARNDQPIELCGKQQTTRPDGPGTHRQDPGARSTVAGRQQQAGDERSCVDGVVVVTVVGEASCPPPTAVPGGDTSQPWGGESAFGGLGAVPLLVGLLGSVGLLWLRRRGSGRAEPASRDGLGERV